MKLKVKVESRAVCSVRALRAAMHHCCTSTPPPMSIWKKAKSKIQISAAERFPGTQGQRRVNFITFLQLIDGIVRMMYDGELVLKNVSL